jgi:hypothetical protein
MQNLPHHDTPPWRQGGKTDLENSWCQRTLCADGTVSGSIFLVGGNNAARSPTTSWSSGSPAFPIEVGIGVECIHGM